MMDGIHVDIKGMEMFKVVRTFNVQEGMRFIPIDS